VAAGGGNPALHKGTPMMTNKLLAPLAGLCLLGLAACGETQGQRAATGGLMGAGAGAAIGSFSGNAGWGALIGAGAGAATGALTAPNRR
jgi:hypothetical protein